MGCGLRLNRERVAIDDEQRTRGRVCFKQTLQQGRRRASFARAARHLDEHLVPSVNDRPANRLDARALKQTPPAAGDPAVDSDVERAAADIASDFPAREIILAEHGLDSAEVSVLALVAEPDFFAVRQEMKGTSSRSA